MSWNSQDGARDMRGCQTSSGLVCSSGGRIDCVSEHCIARRWRKRRSYERRGGSRFRAFCTVSFSSAMRSSCLCSRWRRVRPVEYHRNFNDSVNLHKADLAVACKIGVLFSCGAHGPVEGGAGGDGVGDTFRD